MRRYDPAYRSMKSVLDSGVTGIPLLAHCQHRNTTVPPTFTSEMLSNGAAIHEFDLLRWLFEDDIVAAQVIKPRLNPEAQEGLSDPLLVLLQLRQGAWADIEVSMNARYGCDIRCEIVGRPRHRRPARGRAITGQARRRLDHRGPLRLAGAVRHLLRHRDPGWVDATQSGTAGGPSAWDGYLATAVSEAATTSLSSGALVPVTIAERPSLY